MPEVKRTIIAFLAWLFALFSRVLSKALHILKGGWAKSRGYRIISAVALAIILVDLAVLPYVLSPSEEYEIIEPELSWQWHAEMVGADLAYQEGYRGQGIKIAILDTGIDSEHRDLLGVVRDGSNFAHGPDISYHDSFGHGSHVSGIIASRENGFLGIAPEAEVYSVKMLSDYGWGYWSWARKAIEWSIANEMDIITMSWGAPSIFAPRAFYDAIRDAERRGILLISSAGNQGNSSWESAPASFPEVIAVGAVDVGLRVAGFSAKHEYVELVAPGVIVLATCSGLFRDLYAWAGFGYLSHCWLSGTSMAAPAVSAAAAVLMSSPIPKIADFDMDGAWDADEIRDWLAKTAYDIGGRGRDVESGWGVVDLGMALGLGVKSPAVFESLQKELAISQTLFVDWVNDTYPIEIIARMEG